MRTFIAPFRTAASVHPFLILTPSPSPCLYYSLPPPRPRSGPARVLIANLTSFADSMGFFRHRPMRTIIDDTTGFRAGVNFSSRFFAAQHRNHLPMVDRRFSNYPCLIMRTRGGCTRRESGCHSTSTYSSTPTYLYHLRCPFSVIFFFFFAARVFRGASILRSLITIQNNSLKRNAHCNIPALLNRRRANKILSIFLSQIHLSHKYLLVITTTLCFYR